MLEAVLTKEGVLGCHDRYIIYKLPLYHMIYMISDSWHGMIYNLRDLVGTTYIHIPYIYIYMLYSSNMIKYFTIICLYIYYIWVNKKNAAI